MTWFFADTLDVPTLLDSLKVTISGYQVLCGRYDTTPPTAVVLSNAGVPVEVVNEPTATLAEATAHLPSIADTSASLFARTAHEPYAPTKETMDPDVGSPDAPLLAIKITTFATGGGTAVGLLAQHGVVDAEAMVMFMTHWGAASCGKRGLALWTPPVASHAAPRWRAPTSGDELEEELAAGEGTVDSVLPPVVPPSRKMSPEEMAAAEAAQPAGLRGAITLIPPGETRMPEFLGVMPIINGPDVVCPHRFKPHPVHTPRQKGTCIRVSRENRPSSHSQPRAWPP